MRENERFHSIGIAVLFCIFLVVNLFNTTTSSAAVEIPPPIHGVEIFEYNDSLTQIAGITETYEVKVKNIGVVGLGEVKLGAERLEYGWFSSNETASLEFKDVVTLRYSLSVPTDARGLYVFSIIAYGTSADTTVSNTGIVSLNVLESVPYPALPTTTLPTSPTTTTQATTTQTTKPQPTEPTNQIVLYIAVAFSVVLVVLFFVRRII